MHQVGLAQPDRTVQEQGIVRDSVRLGRAARGNIGELIRLADNEVIEREAGIELAYVAALPCRPGRTAICRRRPRPDGSGRPMR